MSIKWIKENGVLAGMLFTIVTTIATFCFTTNMTFASNAITIKNNSESVKKNRLDISKIDNQPIINTLKINQLSKEIIEQKRITEKFQDQYNKDRDIIIQLLVDIKKK